MAAIYQSTKGRLKPMLGIAIILISVLSLFALDGVLVWLYNKGRISSTVAAAGIGVYALILFLVLLWRFSISCTYSLDGVKLLFCRVYIRNPRLEEQVLVREMLYFGDPEEAARKFDAKRTKSFTARRGVLKTKALIYKREDKLRRVLFSPNEELTQMLTDLIRNKK
ncbi:MAG: hypothetical protein II920_06720 [Clostridia bacterium]|nr:hypothetical protein [Clostridia bacterium]